MKEQDFKVRVKKCMDLIVYHSVNKHMAVAVCAVGFEDASKMLDYINQNL